MTEDAAAADAPRTRPTVVTIRRRGRGWTAFGKIEGEPVRERFTTATQAGAWIATALAAATDE